MRTFALALLAGSTLLGACATREQVPLAQPDNPLARLPTQQYGAALVGAPDEIMLAPHGSLSPAQAAALGELAMRWTDDGGAGPIEITAAAAGPAQGTAQAAAEALVGFGVPPGAVRIAAGPPQGAAPQPVRVAFTRLEPVLADCSSRWAEATRTSSNTVMPNFGCAVNSNMAAMAANARDLAHPRGETPASAERRVDVLTRYGKGEPTATKDDGSRVVVSTAVQ